MKKTLALIAAFTMLGTVSAFAQPVDDSITVTANNNGIFQFSIDLASYAFGTVDSNGTTNVGGDETLLGVRGDTSSLYTSLGGGPSWNAASAPPRTVRIFNASTIAGGSLPPGRLGLRIPDPGPGTSCDVIAFTASGDGGAGACAAGNLIHSMATGSGTTNDVDGELELQLTVDDADPTGATTWTVVLTATGA